MSLLRLFCLLLLALVHLSIAFKWGADLVPPSTFDDDSDTQPIEMQKRFHVKYIRDFARMQRRAL